MAKVEFNYKGIINTILCSEEDKMEEICKRFATKSAADINDLYFIYSGKKVDLQLTFDQITNSLDKERKIMSILVYDIVSRSIKMNSKINQSIFPICPKCKESVRFDINNFKIICSGCKNGHETKMLINEYEDNQKIDISKIKCNECSENKSSTYNNEIYLCNECKVYLCPLCKNTHNKIHNINNYDLKDYICILHNEIYVSYCRECKINICLKCIKVHKTHNHILYSDIMPCKDELLKKLNDFRNTVNIFNKDIEEIINKFKNVKENIEILYNIYNNLINKYEDKYRNYEVLVSLNSINNNNVIKELNNINQIDNINKKIENILNIYEKMNYDDEITLISNINKENKIKSLYLSLCLYST